MRQDCWFQLQLQPYTKGITFRYSSLINGIGYNRIQYSGKWYDRDLARRGQVSKECFQYTLCFVRPCRVASTWWRIDNGGYEEISGHTGSINWSKSYFTARDQAYMQELKVSVVGLTPVFAWKSGSNNVLGITLAWVAVL